MLKSLVEFGRPDAVQRQAASWRSTVIAGFELLFLWMEAMCSVNRLKNTSAKASKNAPMSQQFNRSWPHENPGLKPHRVPLRCWVGVASFCARPLHLLPPVPRSVSAAFLPSHYSLHMALLGVHVSPIGTTLPSYSPLRKKKYLEKIIVISRPHPTL